MHESEKWKGSRSVGSYQAPPSMGFSRQEYWSGVPSPSPRYSAICTLDRLCIMWTYNAGDPSSIPGSGRASGEEIGYPLQYSWTSLVAQQVKNPPAMLETWVGKIPWRRKRLPTLVFWSGEFHGLYSPWGHKELYTTEWLSLHIPYENSFYFLSSNQII